MPAYYAPLVIDSFVGNTGSSSIVEIEVDDDRVVGYAAFEGRKLVRAVFVNLDAWLSSMAAANLTRPSVHLDLGFVLANATAGEDQAVDSVASFLHATMQIRRLGVDHADDLANLTWAGQSYEETPDVSPTGREVVESVPVAQGLTISSSEAVLISFGL